MAILSMIYEDTTANREQLVDIIVRIFHSAIFKQTRNVFLRPIIPEGKNTQTFYDDEYFFSRMVFMEIEPLIAMGRTQGNSTGQLLAECVGMTAPPNRQSILGTSY